MSNAQVGNGYDHEDFDQNLWDYQHQSGLIHAFDSYEDSYDHPQQQVHVEVDSKPEGMGHEIIHIITESGGVWYLLGFAVLGLLGIFKNRIRN